MRVAGVLRQQGAFLRGVGEGHIDDVHGQQLGLARVKAALVHMQRGDGLKGQPQGLGGQGAQRGLGVLLGFQRQGGQGQAQFGEANHGL